MCPGDSFEVNCTIPEIIETIYNNCVGCEYSWTSTILFSILFINDLKLYIQLKIEQKWNITVNM